MNSERGQLERSLQEVGRQLSAATIAYHRAVAQRLGLNETDHKCLDLLLQNGPMTAGDLSQRGGYTTGAVTGIVNRLIAKGFAKRTTDPSDARRVVIEANATEAKSRIGPLLLPMISAMSELNNAYSDDELSLIHGYLSACVATLQSTRPSD